MLRFRGVWALFAAFAVSIANPSPSDATMANALSLQELTLQAHTIFVGTVTGQHARRDDAGRIVTDVRILVEENVFGDATPGDEVVLLRFGGAIGAVGMRIEGEPLFRDGMRVLVFARHVGRTNELLRPVGMSQGVMPIERQGTTTMVLPGGAGLELVGHGSGVPVPAQPALTAPRALDEVLSDVRHLATDR